MIGRMSDVERSKCEQVVLECLMKIAEIVVQSRVSFQPDLGGSHGRRAGGRPQTRRPRFQLFVDEVEIIRQVVCQSRLYEPLQIDIFWDAHAPGASGDGSGGDGGGSTSSSFILLERWSAHFEPSDTMGRGNGRSPYGGINAGRAASSVEQGGGQQLISQLRHVCKEIGVMLRCLHAYTRMLPAQQLFRREARARAVGRRAHLNYSLYYGDAGIGGGGIGDPDRARRGRIQSGAEGSVPIRCGERPGVAMTPPPAAAPRRPGGYSRHGVDTGWEGSGAHVMIEEPLLPI